jgi:hypothetical protein
MDLGDFNPFKRAISQFSTVSQNLSFGKIMPIAFKTGNHRVYLTLPIIL